MSLTNFADFVRHIPRYQLFIFTHDRAFYELIADSISQRNQTEEWKKYEMFAIDEEVSSNNVPEPWINECLDYLEQARAFFSKYEYYAAANSLRKECEKHLKRLYPRHWVVAPKEDGTMSELNLNALDLKLQRFYDRFRFVPSPTPMIDQYRKRILNPASHNDDKASIFRSELKLAISEIARLREIGKEMVTNVEDVRNRVFCLDVENGEKSVHVEFVMLDQMSKLTYEGKIYYESVDIDITAITGQTMKMDGRQLRNVWESVCKYLKLNEDQYPMMEDAVTEKSTGTKLRDWNSTVE